MKYQLEKKIWTDADFEQMGWHDCLIYKMRVSGDLVLDIDYILQWNQPDVEGLPFTFWVAPATLVFKQVKNLILELETGDVFTDVFEIADIEKRVTESGTYWTIATRSGYIEFMSEGYEQFIRQEPFFEFAQTIPSFDRYGVSLERTTEQDNPHRQHKEVIDRRKKEWEQYDIVKKRQQKRQEKEELDKLREANKIDTKDYLLRKREIGEMLDQYDDALKGSSFEHW